MTLTAVVSFVVIGITLAMIVTRRRRLAGTTLIAPYRWTCFAFISLAVAEWLVAQAELRSTTIDAVRYAAATATLCPLAAVLGAKRPQHKGWQFIVLTLWIILILPVGEMMMLWQAGTLDPGPARRWFLVILLLVGLSNYSLSRFWAPALLATAGQLLLLLPQLPLMKLQWPHHSVAGIVLMGLAVALAWVLAQPRRGGWDAVWRDFRDWYGLVWGLRVMERVNSTGKYSGWRSTLTWFGFSPALAEASEQREVERALRTLLRRFVSNDWIDRRHNLSPSGNEIEA